MNEQINQMVIGLKAAGFPISAVEKELSISNGLIGKAAKGERSLAPEKMDALQKFYDVKLGVPAPIEKKQMVVTPKGELKNVPSKECNDALKKVREELNKKYGEGTVMRIGDTPPKKQPVISTGSIGLDLATGIGGLPLGKIVEIRGWESSGKSTISMNVIANAQKQGFRCLLIDAEISFDAEYATALGIDVDALEYCQPSSGEDAGNVAEGYIKSGQVKVIVFDSVAAMLPKGEVEGEVGESKMGLHARLMGQICRKLNALLATHKDVLLVFINQFREKIGIVYGTNEVTTGGNALKFFASMILVVRRSTSKDNTTLSENGDRESNLTTVQVAKNKCAAPFKSANFYIIYGKGIDRVSEILNIAAAKNIIEKKGNTYYYGETKLGVGKEEPKQLLHDNPELAIEIEEKIKL